MKNVKRITDCIREYKDENGKTVTEVFVRVDRDDIELMNYLLDMGLADKLEECMTDMLKKRAYGYSLARKSRFGGAYKDGLEEYDGRNESFMYQIVEVKEDGTERELEFTNDRETAKYFAREYREKLPTDRTELVRYEVRMHLVRDYPIVYDDYRVVKE